MNTTESVRDGHAQLVREYEVAATGTNEVVHGVTFDSGRLVVASGEYLFRLRTDNGRLIEHLQTFPRTGGLAYDGACLWQLGATGIQQVNDRTGVVVRSFAPDVQGITGIECIHGDLLVLHDGGRRLARVRIEDHALTNRAILVSNAPTDVPLRGLAWDGGELWSATDGSLVRIDPTTARIVARLPLSGAPPVCDLAADTEGTLWCVDSASRTVRGYARRGAAEVERRSLRHPQGPPSGRVVDLSTVPRSTEAPVFHTPAQVAGPTFGRILVPVDFGPGSRRAVAAALLMQEQLGSEVHLLHVTEQGANDEFLAGVGAASSPTRLIEDAKARLLRFVDNLFPGRADRIRVHACVGADVVESIETTTKRIAPSLVLLAGRPQHTLFRTNIERITRHTDTAVMVLRVESGVPSA
jgi:nucleotide-binding universal stress UspA family protein